MKLLRECAELFSENRISQASAALSYYLTMTFFPMLIIVSAVLGNNDSIYELLEISERLLSPEITEFIKDYISYVNLVDREIMLPFGLAVLLSYASAALRSLQAVIGTIQGGAEYRGLRSFAVSLIYTFVLLAVTYFALLVMLTGRGVAERIFAVVPHIAFLGGWLYLRYLLLAALMFVLLMGLYHVPKRKTDKYRVLPGAVFSSFALLAVCPIFSAFIAGSVKYSVVYGSIASLILLMLWLYFCCELVYLGAILNVALYKIKTTDS